jgi:predicted ribosome quality control (RQC) complex YloA/Tae2 family protein
LALLKYGRHFRLDDLVKIVVGRTQAENQRLADLHEPNSEFLLRLKAYPGPTVLVRSQASRTALEKAAAICAGYSKAPAEREVEVLLQSSSREAVIRVKPLPPDAIGALLI